MSEALKRTILVTVEFEMDGEAEQKVLDDALSSAVLDAFPGVMGDGESLFLVVKSVEVEVVPTTDADPAAAIAAQRLKEATP